MFGSSFYLKTCTSTNNFTVLVFASEKVKTATNINFKEPEETWTACDQTRCNWKFAISLYVLAVDEYRIQDICRHRNTIEWKVWSKNFVSVFSDFIIADVWSHEKVDNFCIRMSKDKVCCGLSTHSWTLTVSLSTCLLNLFTSWTSKRLGV